MVLGAVLSLLVPAATLPENAILDYSGLPALRGASVRVMTHGVSLNVGDDGTVTVQSTTVYRNLSKKDSTAVVYIPRRRHSPASDGSAPDFVIQASWDRLPISLKATEPHVPDEPLTQAADLMASVPLKAEGTHALRIAYKTKFGKGGYGMDQRFVGYLLGGTQQIELLSLAYRYGGKTVFSLPTPTPNIGWEVGNSGVHTRRQPFTPNGVLTTIAFYPGDFSPIGK